MKHRLETELNTLIASDPEMWRFLQQGSLDGVWYWDLEKPDQEWMSPELWQLFGIDPHTKRHDPSEWQDIIFKEDLEIAVDNFKKHCADPAHPYDQVVRYRHADGSTVWVRCRGLAIRDADGNPIRMLGAHNDLTAVKRGEEEAKREKAKLETANGELQSFVYGVSHDLKSPARTANQLVVEVLRDSDNLTDQQRRFLQNACDTLGRMHGLVDNLLDYGRLVEHDMQWRDVDLNKVVAHVMSDLSADIEESGATIDICETLPTIKGDESQLRMLMQNLIANAIKFHRPDVPPEVSVICRRAGRATIIEVRDNGLGIDPKHQQKIFNVFSRLHRRDEIPGNGLGLALCRRIAMNHNGEISVRSAKEDGSVFKVRLERSE